MWYNVIFSRRKTIMDEGSLYILLAVISYSYALQCYDCQSVNNTEECTSLTSCHDNQSCMIRQYVDEKTEVKYDLSCISDSFCEEVSRVRRSGEMVVWTRCCRHDHCNMHFNLHGDKYDNVYCLECDKVDSPDDCNTETICGQREICYTRMFLDYRNKPAYRLGCESLEICKLYKTFEKMYGGRHDASLGGDEIVQAEDPGCFDCCNNKNCNNNLCTRNHETTTLIQSNSSYRTTVATTKSTGKKTTTRSLTSTVTTTKSPLTTNITTTTLSLTTVLSTTAEWTSTTPSFTTTLTTTSPLLTTKVTTSATTLTSATPSSTTKVTTTPSSLKTTNISLINPSTASTSAAPTRTRTLSTSTTTDRSISRSSSTTSESTLQTTKSSTVVAGCAGGHSILNDTCYTFNLRKMNWPDAARTCETQGGQLASITSSAQDTFIVQQLTALNPSVRGLWIGAIFKNDTFRWMDGRKVTYERLESSLNPPDQTGVCLYISNPSSLWLPSWLWSSDTCQLYQHAFICEIKLG